MHIHYLILAHTNPRQLKRLIDRLSFENSFFYIHIDKRVDINPFLLEIPTKGNIFYISNKERHASKWGSVETVRATIALLKNVQINVYPGYCVLMSGQDYPLKSNKQIYSFFKKSFDTEFVNYFILPSKKWPMKGREGKERLYEYKIELSDKRGDHLFYPSVFEKSFFTRENVLKLSILFKLKKGKELFQLFSLRRFPKDLIPYGGSQWWAITTETAQKTLDYIYQHPNYLKYHRYTLLPDEIFFQSIIMNIHRNSSKRIAQTLTYVDWERKGVSLPVTFTIDDFRELKNLKIDILFARKFDIELDHRILGKIDEELLEYPLLVMSHLYSCEIKFSSFMY